MSFTFPKNYKETLSQLSDNQQEQGLILKQLVRKDVFETGVLGDFFKEESETLILILDQKMFENSHRMMKLIADLEGEDLAE